MTDRRDSTEDILPSRLNEAIEALRVVPEPSPAWRDRVLAELEGTPPLYLASAVELGAPRFWSVRPRYAVAAALLCAIAGGAASAIAPFGSAERTAVTAQPVVPATRLEQPVHFRYTAPTAATVSLAGDFNAWNPQAHRLRRSADASTWELDVRLPPGRYAYAFVVDGKLAPDPDAPKSADDDFGTPHSILLVTGS